MLRGFSTVLATARRHGPHVSAWHDMLLVAMPWCVAQACCINAALHAIPAQAGCAWRTGPDQEDPHHTDPPYHFISMFLYLLNPGPLGQYLDSVCQLFVTVVVNTHTLRVAHPGLTRGASQLENK